MARGAGARLHLGTATLAAIVGSHVSAAVEARQEGDAPTDEVIVLGNAAELRRQLRLAEDAMYLRFNDINSDDRLDVHCRDEVFLGSRIPHRTCQSNGWREMDAAHAQGVLGVMRGESTVPPQMYLIEQQRGQRQLMREMRRLSATDEPLALAVRRLGQAQQALRGPRAGLTAWLQVPPEQYDVATARRAFEVRIGREPWLLGLEEPTFTFANVSGRIRGIEIECPERSQSFRYESDVEWTVPASWGECALLVSAERNTTFTLFAFE